MSPMPDSGGEDESLLDAVVALLKQGLIAFEVPTDRDLGQLTRLRLTARGERVRQRASMLQNGNGMKTVEK